MFGVTNIYKYLTQKQINNADIHWHEPTAKELFLSDKNLAKIASQMFRYYSTKYKMDYFNYKVEIFKYMNKWAETYSFSGLDINPNRINILELNSIFMDKHRFLFEKPLTTIENNKVVPVIDNVWRHNISLYDYDPDTKTINKTVKSGANLMAEDYGKLDLWEDGAVYFDYDFVNKWKSFRQWGHANPIIPRHVDRANEGLQCKDPNRASLTQHQRGYDMSEWYNAKGI